MVEEQSTVLTPAQSRGVLALLYERDQLIRLANEELARIDEAFQAQGAMLARINGLPNGKGWTYRFDEEPATDGKRRLKLAALPPQSTGEPETKEE